MKHNVIQEKSFDFAGEIVEVCRYLQDNQREYILSKQLMRSGTAIGANMREAASAISKAEFIAKAQISLKEASETEYWILLLIRGKYLPQDTKILEQARELFRILTAILKTSKENMGDKYKK